MIKQITIVIFVVSSAFAANAKYVERPNNLAHPVTSWATALSNRAGAEEFTCAVDQLGLKCWGWVPWETPAWPKGTQLTSGRSHMCGLIGEEIRCIGSGNEYGELNPPSILEPTRISAGEFFTCAITKSKNVVCWGKNDFGQATPPANLVGVVSLSTSRNHACALSGTGKITCWGDNSFGQLNVPENLGVVRSLEEKYDKNEIRHFWSDGTCANDLFGGLAERKVCWGKNYWGPRVTLAFPKVQDLELRAGNSSYSCGLYQGLLLCEGHIPKANLPLLRNVKSFTMGRDQACAVKDDSTTVCWGQLN